MPANTTFLNDYQAPQFAIETLDLSFDLFDDFALVESQMSVSCLTDNRCLSLVGDELQLQGVWLNGVALRDEGYEVCDSQLTIKDVPERFDLKVQTRIKPQLNTQLSGLYRTHDLFCTQCEAEGFRRISYFLDRPDVMTVYTSKIIADKARFPVLLSNGNKIEQGDLANGRHFVTWQDPFKKPSYLFALVAGNLAQIEDTFTTQSGRVVDLHIYVEPGNEDKCLHAMNSLKAAMRWDEVHYNREYDLDIFMIVAVSDFNMGAMENKGLNVFNSKYILASSDTASDKDYAGIESVVAHEYFHNWTGNRITCRDWFQLSLKEGLTVFRDQEFSRDMNSRAVNRIDDVKVLRNAQFPEDAGPMAHPVRPDSYIEINNFYTATIYNKGCEVIRMQQTLLGAEGFDKGMSLYFERHDGQAVTIDDFVACMSDANDRDLSQFKRWYSQAGTPEVDVAVEYDEIAKKLTLNMTQSCRPTPETAEKEAFHIPIKMALFNSSGQALELGTSLLELTESHQSFEIESVEEKPVISLLRDFSAPIKLHMPYTDCELHHLIKHESDGFARWEASQRLALKYLNQLVESPDTTLLPDDLFETYQHLLEDDLLDNALKAQLLTPPSFEDVANGMTDIDVSKVCQAQRLYSQTVGGVLFEELHALYEQLAGCYGGEMHAKAYANRSLKRACMAFLLEASPQKARPMCYQQFSQAQTMTDEIGALMLLVNHQCQETQQALDAFYHKWQNDELVMDKWFTAQAISRLPNCLQNVQSLMSHHKFSLKNPNKVRALLGAFCSANPLNFHQVNGDAYRFLSDVLIKIDALNPQISSRMVVPLTRWQRYDSVRQSLMKKTLQTLLTENNLSKDLYEMVSKSLEV